MAPFTVLALRERKTDKVVEIGKLQNHQNYDTSRYGLLYKVNIKPKKKSA